ncbi:preprotein translocase subunit SecE [Minwuia thermotolerans]|jgi:preprotein translocase subunit SecE|uniref:Protein translocase subunit SecE n=1 Tax=Minwuia thermotolerans TaxID=2056226 RepID=A0A2M9FYW7_9PROT|nr:preprotein translocase subunit SecE [Minwuia thermotolerans]ANK83156.1 MAG: preprotein translocase subunit SecE [Rhizobiales bacterium NRL2]PJK28644.1 preprotein translocase subunit SecE [Minwuia thermotolerans]
MAKSKSGTPRGRGQKTTPAASSKPADKPAPKKKVGPVEFLRQVRAEGARTTWPTRKETGVTTMMVFIMVAIAAVFFLVVDIIIQTGVGFILELGS